MEKARYNTELYSNLRAHLNNVKPSNFWGSHQINGHPLFVSALMILPENLIQNVCKAISCIQKLLFEERREVIYKLI